MKGWTVQKRLSLPFHLSPADMSIAQENTSSYSPRVQKSWITEGVKPQKIQGMHQAHLCPSQERVLWVACYQILYNSHAYHSALPTLTTH